MKKIILMTLCSLFSSLAVASSGIAKKEITTNQAPAPIGVYSQAIQVENTVYISGQIPLDPTTSALASGDFSNQVRRTIENIQAIARAAGGDVDNIVKLTVYLDDLQNFPVVNDVMKEYFHQPFPARAVVEIKSLPKHAPIEIEAVMQL